MCVTMTSLASASLVERVSLTSYMFLSLINSVLNFSLIRAWTLDGWIGIQGFTDRGGSASIHVIAGFASLVSTIMVGSRFGRFSN